MTMQPANYLMENPVKSAQKSKHYQKAKGMSFFAFLFSIVIYISIFYIFSLSPSTLMNNTKFWFVISNTLILIIAADYGSYSAYKAQKRDLYEEYSLQSQARRNSFATAANSSFVSEYPEIVKKSMAKEEEISWKQTKKEDIADQKNKEIPERIVEVVKFEPKTDNFQAIKGQQDQPLELHPIKADKKPCHHHHDQVKYYKKKTDQPKTIVRRSKSDKVKRVTFHDKKNNLQRSKTEKHYEPSTAKEKHDEPSTAKETEIIPEEENEFSTMSDEELNRRVEEFIQKMNREIKLQESRC